MDINFFREFAVLARTGSYSEAAEQLFLSQPSLSKHIKSAELELGRPLFRRTTRRIELTPFGAALLPYAEQIAALQDEYTARLLHVPQEKAVISLGLGYPLPEKTIVYELAVGACRAAGFEPNVVFTSPSCENIFYLIEKGSGVSIVAPKHLPAHDNVRLVPILPPIRTAVSVCYRADHLSPAAALFLDHIRERFPDARIKLK